MTALLSVFPDLLRRRRLNGRARQLEQALPGAELVELPGLYEELGDVYLELGNPAAAGTIGSAIDACLAIGRLESAATLCTRMIEAVPDVIRAHGTLAVLLLARGSYRDAERELAHYLRLSRKDGTASYASERLQVAAHAFPELEARILMGRMLRKIGHVAAAEEIEEMEVAPLTRVAQRRLLASQLGRSMRPQRLRSDAPPALTLHRRETMTSADEELPLLDTSILRGTHAPTPEEQREPEVPQELQKDLPWLDVSLTDRPDAPPAEPASESAEPHAWPPATMKSRSRSRRSSVATQMDRSVRAAS